MYLYIDEDGTVKKNSDEPTKVDLLSADTGILTIIRVRDLKQYVNSRWVEIEEFEVDDSLDDLETEED